MKISAAAIGAILFIAIQPAHSESFENHQVAIFRGPFAKPDFRSLPRSEMYKTRILDGAKQGVNFAGHYAIVRIGCGTGCTFSYLINLKSGNISDFPFSGEVYSMLGFEHRPSSNLIKVSWSEFLDRDYDKPICVRQELVLEKSELRLLEKSTSTAPKSYCE